MVNLLSSFSFLSLSSLLLFTDDVTQLKFLSTILISNLIGSLSLLSTLLIAADQYLAILHALRYHNVMSKMRVSLSLAGVWLSSVFLTVIIYLLLYFGTKSDGLRLTASIVLLATFIVPMIAMAVIYTKIYLVAHTSSEKVRKSSLRPSETFLGEVMATESTQVNFVENSSSVLNFQSEDSSYRLNPTSTEGIRRASTSSCMREETTNCHRKTSLPANSVRFHENVGHIRYRISSANHFTQREEGRTAKIYLLSFAALIVCWSPFYVYQFLVLNEVMEMTQEFSVFANLFSFSYAFLSPFIFALRNKKMRSEVLGILPIKFAKDEFSPFTVSTEVMSQDLVPLPVQNSARKQCDNVDKALLRVPLGSETSPRSSFSSVSSQFSKLSVASPILQ